jgi:putative ATP-dependent endonuclease of the OLD family
MRLIGLTVENFRCYGAPVSVRIGDLTALVGRNDVGKSSLMDALAIFFGFAEPDKDDACKSGDPASMRITCEFDQLPPQLIVDAEFPTTLLAEHLESSSGTFVVRKTYNCSGAKPKTASVDAICLHPTADIANRH